MTLLDRIIEGILAVFFIGLIVLCAVGVFSEPLRTIVGIVAPLLGILTLLAWWLIHEE